MINLIEQTANDTKLYDLLNLPSLLIVIDAWAWKVNTPKSQAVIKNIVDFVTNENLTLQAVALASYVDSASETVMIEEPWHTNAKKMFYTSTRWEVLRNVWQKTTFNRPTQSWTDQNILSLIKDDRCEYFTLWDHNQLLYYMNFVNPCVKNIIITGFAWRYCLEFRSLGHTALSNLLHYNMLDKDCNILTHKQLVGIVDDECLDVYAPWAEIGNDWLKIDINQYAGMIEECRS